MKQFGSICPKDWRADIRFSSLDFQHQAGGNQNSKDRSCRRNANQSKAVSFAHLAVFFIAISGCQCQYKISVIAPVVVGSIKNNENQMMKIWKNENQSICGNKHIF